MKRRKDPLEAQPSGNPSPEPGRPERPISPYGRPEEQAIEMALRPQRLEEFIGQDRVKENLRILIEAARARGGP